MKSKKPTHDIRSIEQAISILEKPQNKFPFDAIKYLYDLEPDEKVKEKVVFHLSNVFNKKLYYQRNSRYGPYTPLYFAILAEKHNDERLIDLIINLYIVEEDEELEMELLYDQGNQLVWIICDKYNDIALPKIFDAIERVADTDMETPVIYLSDALFFADKRKYKKRILKIVAKDEFYGYEDFVKDIAQLQIKEAIPFIKEKLNKVKLKKFYEKNSWFYSTLEDSLEELVTGNIDDPYNAKEYYQKGRDWFRNYSFHFKR